MKKYFFGLVILFVVLITGALFLFKNGPNKTQNK